MTTRERPIIMSAESVRAILAGTKRQSRRVIKPQPIADLSWITEWGWTFFTPEKHISGRGIHPANGPSEVFLRCPYALGQTLWARETWRKGLTDSGLTVEYKADNGRVYWADYPDDSIDWYWLPDMPWKSPLFMPRWASRIMLAIESVRVERINEISEADAKAEGAVAWHDTVDGTVYRPEFKMLWDSLNAKRGYPFDSGAWVWAVTFRRVTP